MWPKTHEQAQQIVCGPGLEVGDHFLCYGEGCSYWEREPEADRKARGSDITPRGYCIKSLVQVYASVD